MRLYLVQHGEAEPKEIDPDRPLTARGREDVQRVAAALAGSGIEIQTIEHSGKTRARQTAEILAAELGSRPVQAIDGIGPLDSVAEFAHQLAGWTANTMVVGHLPFMGKLVSLLTCGSEAAAVASFKPGTIVCLELSEDQRWAISWMLRTELAVSSEQ